jgi:hypothetical protein
MEVQVKMEFKDPREWLEMEVNQVNLVRLVYLDQMESEDPEVLTGKLEMRVIMGVTVVMVLLDNKGQRDGLVIEVPTETLAHLVLRVTKETWVPLDKLALGLSDLEVILVIEVFLGLGESLVWLVMTEPLGALALRVILGMWVYLGGQVLAEIQEELEKMGKMDPRATQGQKETKVNLVSWGRKAMLGQASLDLLGILVLKENKENMV